MHRKIAHLSAVSLRFAERRMNFPNPFHPLQKIQHVLHCEVGEVPELNVGGGRVSFRNHLPSLNPITPQFIGLEARCLHRCHCPAKNLTESDGGGIALPACKDMLRESELQQIHFPSPYHVG